MCSPGRQCIWECFFFRYMELNSRFDVMTTNVIPFDRTKIATGFSVIRYFVCWLRPVTSSKVCSEFFASYKLIPCRSGFSDSVISSRQFLCTICAWEYEVFTISRRYHFALSLRAWISDTSKFSSSMSATQIVLAEFSRIHCIYTEHSR